MYPQPFPPPPPPRKSSGTGCLIAFLVGVGIVAVGLVLILHKSPEERAADAKRLAEYEDAAAQQAAANDQARLDFEAKVRKGCKLKSDASVFVPNDDKIVRERCRAMVEEGLKVPGSAEFERDENELVSDDGCNRIYESSVLAQNAFGVKVKTRFACKLDPRTGIYSYKVLP